jgi:hypothetical protein
MFDLEQAISEWRKQMLNAGIQTPVPLEELEIHLREEIERQVQSGFSEANAFESATWKIGQAWVLKNEFKKVERYLTKRRLMVGVGIFVLLFGITMILPALGKHKQRNQAALSAGATFFDVKWASDETYGLLLGTTFFAAGVASAFYGLKKREG